MKRLFFRNVPFRCCPIAVSCGESFSVACADFFYFVGMKMTGEELRVIYFHLAVFQFTVYNTLNPSLSKASHGDYELSRHICKNQPKAQWGYC